MIFGHIEGVAEVDKIFAGVRAAVAALILVSALKLAKKIFVGVTAKIIALVAFGLLVFTNVDAIIIILAGGAFGILSALWNNFLTEKEQKDKENK